ncbi:hypothetical protein [Defluviitalea saccharophila]|uniref:MarR family transcriptional regulator n=1 Tax=Defluviitalea saccharophila TaxID=879970 RepID=A0ABZ2Y866_9FIRM
MKKYKKISKEDVLKLLASIAADPLNPTGGIINIVNIAEVLKTSRYQVKKCINELKHAGVVELDHIDVSEEDEIYPPYWGYALTEKGKQHPVYKETKEKTMKIFKECFELD